MFVGIEADDVLLAKYVICKDQVCCSVLQFVAVCCSFGSVSQCVKDGRYLFVWGVETCQMCISVCA